MSAVMQARAMTNRHALLAAFVLCLGLFGLPVAWSADASKLIGLTVPPWPDGSVELGGKCLGKVTVSGCTQTVGEIGNENAGITGLYVGSFIDADAQGHPRWRVTDFVAVPMAKKPFVFTDSACRYRGHDDESIAAIVHEEGDDKAWLKAKDWAYRVDLATGKFIKLAAADVECSNLAREAD